MNMLAPSPALQAAIANQVARGARLEYQAHDHAVLVYGGKVNHVPHIILSIVTLGLWLIVWFIVALTTKPRRLTISVDEHGQPVFWSQGERVPPPMVVRRAA